MYLPFHTVDHTESIFKVFSVVRYLEWRRNNLKFGLSTFKAILVLLGQIELQSKLDTFDKISLREWTIFESLKLILELFKSCVLALFLDPKGSLVMLFSSENVDILVL